MKRRRVAVTGLGVVTGPGLGVEAFWEGLTKDPGKGPFTIDNWDPSALIPRREARRLDLFSQYARVAAPRSAGDGGRPWDRPLAVGSLRGDRNRRDAIVRGFGERGLPQ